MTVNELIGKDDIELLTLGFGYYKGQLSFYGDLARFASNEDLRLFLETGVVYNNAIFTRLSKEELSVFSASVVNEEVSIEVRSDFERRYISVYGYSEGFTINGVRYVKQNNYRLLVNLSSGESYPSHIGRAGLSINKFPIVSENETYHFFKEMERYMQSKIADWEKEFSLSASIKQWQAPLKVKSANDLGVECDYAYEFAIQAFNGGAESKVQDNYDEDDNPLFFDLCLRVVSVKWRTFVFLESVNVPIAMQRRGIYGGICKLIADFMNKHNLGNEIGCTDSSDNEETSRVAERFGLLCDPFMERHYNLDVRTDHDFVETMNMFG